MLGSGRQRCRSGQARTAGRARPLYRPGPCVRQSARPLPAASASGAAAPGPGRSSGSGTDGGRRRCWREFTCLWLRVRAARSARRRRRAAHASPGLSEASGPSRGGGLGVHLSADGHRSELAARLNAQRPCRGRAPGEASGLGAARAVLLPVWSRTLARRLSSGALLSPARPLRGLGAPQQEARPSRAHRADGRASPERDAEVFPSIDRGLARAA